MSHDAKFIVDVMLGRLSRWLRILGFDALYESNYSDGAIAQISERDRRIVLTRDHGLLKRRSVHRGLLIASAHTGDQLKQVVREIEISPRDVRPLSRCSVCNSSLQAAGPDAMTSVPPFVRRTNHRFWACPGCRRVYWKGTHRDVLRRTVRRWLGPEWILRDPLDDTPDREPER